MPTKGKYVTKKRNPSSLDPVRTTIAQIHVKKQNYITKKKTLLCLTWSVRTMICMQILKRDPEKTFFSWPKQRRHEAEEEIFSHKNLLTWLGPSKQPTDAGDSDPREHQPTNSQSWAKRPRFSVRKTLICSLKKDSQISNPWRKCLRFFLKEVSDFFEKKFSDSFLRKCLKFSLKKMSHNLSEENLSSIYLS